VSKINHYGKLVLFDLAGTLVTEKNEGGSLVASSLSEAFSLSGFSVTGGQIRTIRGKEKKEGISELLKQLSNSETAVVEGTVQVIYTDFIRLIKDHLSDFAEIPGTAEVFRTLEKMNMAVGIGSGFPLKIIKALIDFTGWKNQADIPYINSFENFPNGRPSPLMVFDFMRQFNIKDPKNVLKVGDTTADMREGKAAGCITVGVLSGAHDRKTIQAENPDYILPDITYIPALFQDLK